MFDLLIRNGQLVLPDRVERGDVAVENETIVQIAPTIAGPARHEIDATNLHVFPGLIDPHVHFNEPGRTDWEGFGTGSSALAAGGGTMFFDMPLNSSPPVLDAESFDLKLEAAKKNSFTDFALWGGLTPNNLDQLEELAERGVVGFKAFMCDSGIEDFPHADIDTLVAGMTKAAKLGLPVGVHAELPSALAEARAKVAGHTWADYLASRPFSCEFLAIHWASVCAMYTKCSLHIVHLSKWPAGSLSFMSLRDAVDITFETCPHYFAFSSDDLLRIGAPLKCSPPLRDELDGRALINQLDAGQIDFIASDHSPAPASMKSGDDAFAIWGGVAGVQSTLPSLLTRWMDASLPLGKLGPIIASNAAKRFAIAGKGSIAVGFDADFTLVDTNERFTLTRDMLLDRHKLSPYVGRTFRGRILRTILRGQTIFENGRMIGAPRGRFVRPAIS